MKRHNDQKIGDALKDMLDKYRLNSKFNQTKIKSLWESLMGPSISRYTKDIVVRRKKLFVTLESSPLKQELSLGKEKIKNIINDELGEEFIEEVVIL
jgi:predicted nucleic acid-binding Zn ribbon protein